MHAVIIEGNPKYIAGNQLAIDYYNDIEAFLKKNGVGTITRDLGADYTCPPKADLYIGHSRGAARIRCMKKGDEFRFLIFGDIDGIIHPDDAKWQAEHKPGGDDHPPACHYEFMMEQKAAILALLSRLKKPTARMLT